MSLAGLAPAETGTWVDHAGCRTVGDPEIFFPRSLESVDTPEILMALAICRECPVIAECAAMADRFEGTRTKGSLYGIFGGELPAARYTRRRRAWKAKAAAKKQEAKK